MRPPRGHTFEEAVSIWSPPDAYQRLEQALQSQLYRIKKDPVALAKVSEPMEHAIFERLRRGELLSSVPVAGGGEEGQRELIPPQRYATLFVTYDWARKEIVGPDFRLRKVEIFTPHRIPSNIPDPQGRPGWPTAVDSATLKPFRGTPTLDRFRHDDTYEHVWLDGREFLLTALQASVVERLHQAARTGQPWIHVNDLRDAIGFSTAKISGLFRRMPDWRVLILSDGRGHYRLNI